MSENQKIRTKSNKNHIFLLLFFFVFYVNSNLTYSKNIFKSLLANPYEARVGTIYDNTNDRLRLDIGTSLDLMNIFKDSSNTLNIGTDLMTYTRLRSEGKLKFPVETSDYFFGINISGKYIFDDDVSIDNSNDNNEVKSKTKTQNSNFLEYRIRIAHISSHLVDGYTDNNYEFLQSPFVYSREFVDAVCAINIDDSRIYLGLNSVFSTQPKNFTAFIPQAGIEHKINIYNNLDITAGYDLKLIGINKILRATNAIQAGFLYGEQDSPKVFAGVYYYAGPSMHGMFYNSIDKYFGIGFQVIP